MELKKQKKVILNLYITGFEKYADILTNPTSTIIKELQ